MASNKYICRHCNANLDDGDIYEYFLSEYNDHDKALLSASSYGWTETDKKHFTLDIIVQPLFQGKQYTVCPYCEEKHPLTDD